MPRPPLRPICLFTDFGVGSPYVGQMQAVLAAAVPSVPVIDLLSDAPAFRPDLAAYLLPALTRDLPPGAALVCVVDPGVGTERGALAVEADGRWHLGPDNGLLSVVVRRARRARVLRVDWRPEWMSDSFHGRDLFAPAAARLASGAELGAVPMQPRAMVGADWPAELSAVVYVDAYGNLFTGLPSEGMPDGAVLEVGGREVRFARVFAEAPGGRPFWYRNSCGLVEIAWDRDSAAARIGVGPGAPVTRLR